MLPVELPQGERGPQALWVRHGTALTQVYTIQYTNQKLCSWSPYIACVASYDFTWAYALPTELCSSFASPKIILVTRHKSAISTGHL